MDRRFYCWHDSWRSARICHSGQYRCVGVLIMPYKHIEKKIPRSLDRRVKLTDDDKARIAKLYKQGEPVREIARQFEKICSRRSIQLILFPERRARLAEAFKQRRKDGRYYNREKWRERQREHRKYKQGLYLANKLL